MSVAEYCQRYPQNSWIVFLAAAYDLDFETMREAYCRTQEISPDNPLQNELLGLALIQMNPAHTAEDVAHYSECFL